MTGSDVGVVVVGETPYAEGVGDVGNGKTVDLSAADKAAVDKVCAAMRCVVLIVSGRPMNIVPIQSEANAIVESWLPGTEGAGVADTLFGLKPFTGRLPDTWAKQVDATTTPVDVGIPTTTGTYDPLYPYGWGLRTDSEKTRITTVRDALAKQPDFTSKLGAVTLSALLAGQGNWNADGSLRNPAVALALIALAAPAVSGTSQTAEANANLLVSVVRDFTQKAVVAGGATAMTKTAATTADAEHALESGNPINAIAGLTKAWLAAQAK
jgi:beta-glucosidase